MIVGFLGQFHPEHPLGNEHGPRAFRQRVALLETFGGIYLSVMLLIAPFVEAAVVELDIALRGVDLDVSIAFVAGTGGIAFQQNFTSGVEVELFALGEVGVLDRCAFLELRDRHRNEFVRPLVARNVTGRHPARFQLQVDHLACMTGFDDVALGLVVEQHVVKGRVEVALLPIVVRHDFQRAVGLLFERYAPFGGDAHAAGFHLRPHFDQSVRFVPVGHRLQMGFEVFHTDAHALHIRRVDSRNIHRLETGNRDLLFHFCELFGRIDAVVFEQLRIEVDFDEFVQHAFGHDEDVRDTRFYRVLRLLHEFGEKRLQSRLVRVHIEQFGDIRRSGVERLDVSVFVDTADGLQLALLTFSGLPDEHYLLLVVLYFFVHLCEILD